MKAIFFFQLLLFFFLTINQTVMASSDDLHKAIRNDQLGLLREFIDKKRDVNEENFAKRRPIYEAIDYNNIDAVRILLENGADINTPDSHGEIPLFWCLNLTRISPPIVDLIFEKTDDFDNKRVYGQTLLYWAISNRKDYLAKKIMDKMSGVNQINDSGETVAEIAVEMGNLALLFKIVEKGIDINWRNKKGKSVAEIALELSQFEIFKFLVEKGADLKLLSKHLMANFFVNHSEWAMQNEKIKEWIKGLSPLERDDFFDQISSRVNPSFPQEEAKMALFLEREILKKSFELNYFISRGYSPFMALRLKTICPSCQDKDILDFMRQGGKATALRKINGALEATPVQIRALTTIKKRVEKSRKILKWKRDHLLLAERYEKEGKINQAIWAYQEVGNCQAEARADELRKILREILENGTISNEKIVVGGATVPKIVDINYNRGGVQYQIRGILKRDVGKIYSSLEAEVFASFLNDFLKITVVPVTVFREINGEKYSLQYFWVGEDKWSYHYYSNEDHGLNDLHLFDYLTENADRHSGNYFRGESRAICGQRAPVIGIDHGALWGKGINPQFIKDYSGKFPESLFPTPRFIMALKRLDENQFRSQVLARSLATEVELNGFFVRRKEILDKLYSAQVKAIDVDGKNLCELYWGDRTFIRH